MRGRLKWAVGVAVLAAAAAVGTVAVAGGGRDIDENLTGFEENPSVSTTGNGSFEARVDRRNEEISYRLEYADLEGEVTQAHIHFSQRAVNGGISAFLCTNIGGGTATTPACPGPNDGTVEGTLTAADVVGPEGQGIEPGAFGELVDAIKAGVTYANVHSTKWPAGEIRAQLEDDDRGGDRDDD